MYKKIACIVVLSILFIAGSGLYYIISLHYIKTHAINSYADETAHIKNIETITA